MERGAACGRDENVVDVITCGLEHSLRAVSSARRRAEKCPTPCPEHASRYGLISRACSRDVPQIGPQASLLSEHLFFPTYDKMVMYYPESWTPNGVTIFGVSMTLLSSFLLLASMPIQSIFTFAQAKVWSLSADAQTDNRLTGTWTMKPHGTAMTPLYPMPAQHALHSLWITPSALLILCGVLNMVYCCADNTDGRLARRLRKTSFLGEYLDHGLDCVTSLMSTFLALSVVGVSMPHVCVASLVVAVTTVLSHTLNYEHHIFIWGSRLCSVDEAMVLFGIAMWVPVIIPSIGTSSIADLLLGGPVSWPWCDRMLNTLTVPDAAYVILCVANVHTMALIVRHDVYMCLRMQVLGMLVNMVVLVVGLTIHSNHILRTLAGRNRNKAAALMANEMALGEASSYVAEYMYGPFSYAALWVILFACTSSVIVHIPVAAKCARLSRVSLYPMIGLAMIWVTFIYWPTMAVVAAVGLHVVQIMYNLQLIHHNRSREHELQNNNKKD